MNSQCSHSQKITSESQISCALCNCFISSNDGTCAIKDTSLGGLHQTYPHGIFTRLLDERKVLPKDGIMAYSYMSVRTLLIDWLNIMKTRLGLSESTFHIAIRYMDFVLAQKDYHQSKYQLIALSCLTIAAKYDELDRKIPFPEDFSRLGRLPFRTIVLTECEMLLLKILDWQLKVSTTYDMVHCLLSQGVLFDDDMLSNGEKPSLKHAAYLTKIAKHFVSDSVRINKFVLEDQGQLAVAIILSSRKALGLQNVWSKYMEELTGFDFMQIKQTYEMFSSEYEEDIKFSCNEMENMLEEPAICDIENRNINEPIEKMPLEEKEVVSNTMKVTRKPRLTSKMIEQIMPGLKENYEAASPMNKFEQVNNMFKMRAEQNKDMMAFARLKEPLGVSQRLNISG